MEEEQNYPTIFGMEILSEHLKNCYFQSNWDNDQNDPFESALSSMVSSPIGAPSNGGDGDGMMIKELIGRLGSITDSDYNNSTNNSCYSTPLNSPPKINFPKYPPNFATLNADPGFVERAANKFSCFGNNNNNNIGKKSRGNVQIDVNLGGFFERKIGGILSQENGEMGDSREGSSVSQNDANSRKRKSIPKAKLKGLNSHASKDDKVEVENEESNVKRSKHDDQDAKKEKDNNNNNNNNNNNKNDNNKDSAKAEPPKDYIHVRARRGQATDSHSLAERVRREKISERMKFLQDLVPGCNKVTGKATVLDEIINYVQSLQHQVEFLSMKLATVNPRMELNMEALLSKDMFQSRGGTISQTMYPLDQNSQEASPFGYQSSQQFPPPTLQLENNNHFSLNAPNPAGIRRNPGFHLPSMDGFVDSMTQVPTFWEDDLQSIVQMGTLPDALMKIEL